MKVAIASDHAGYDLKERIKRQFSDIAFEDFGCHSIESVDYPDYVKPLADYVLTNECFGIVICGSGNGVSMTVNKFDGIRCGLSWNIEIAELTRLHNDANVLGIPARYISEDEAFKIVEIFLNTDFEGGRHQRRVDKINNCL